uniref:Thioredoxin domain-containing protein n=1 Tax=Balaenoptera musculus TaxID=9771 RepID=A0A8C0DGI5_BALMU
MVKQIENKYAFQEALNSAGEKLVVVDHTWCGPCKMIKPFFHSLSEKYSNCEVKCMPTFQFFKKGQKFPQTLLWEFDSLKYLRNWFYRPDRSSNLSSKECGHYC